MIGLAFSCAHRVVKRDDGRRSKQGEKMQPEGPASCAGLRRIAVPKLVAPATDPGPIASGLYPRPPQGMADSSGASTPRSVSAACLLVYADCASCQAIPRTDWLICHGWDEWAGAKRRPPTAIHRTRSCLPRTESQRETPRPRLLRYDERGVGDVGVQPVTGPRPKQGIVPGIYPGPKVACPIVVVERVLHRAVSYSLREG